MREFCEGTVAFLSHDVVEIGLPVFLSRVTLAIGSNSVFSAFTWLQAFGLAALAIFNAGQLPSLFNDTSFQPIWFWEGFAPLLAAEVVICILSLRPFGKWSADSFIALFAGTATLAAIYAKRPFELLQLTMTVASSTMVFHSQFAKRIYLGRWGCASAIGILIHLVLPSLCTYILPVRELSEAYGAILAFHDAEQLRSTVIRLLIVSAHVQVSNYRSRKRNTYQLARMKDHSPKIFTNSVVRDQLCQFYLKNLFHDTP
jgi:hypothetical protein